MDKEKNEEKPYNIMDDPAEFAHFKNICAALLHYKHDSIKDVLRIKKNYSMLPSDQLTKLIYPPEERINKLKAAIENNFNFLKQIAAEYGQLFDFEYDKDNLPIVPESWNINVAQKDVSKAQQVLRQFVRDWSVEGKEERDECYGPMKEAIFKKYNLPENRDGKSVRILVPGCGLGRLVYDLASEGFATQGNEFSYFMLIPSNFVLNCTEKCQYSFEQMELFLLEFQFSIQPYIHSFSNTIKEDDPFINYKIPDVNLRNMINPKTEFSMAAGEFVEVYQKPNEIGNWNCVATCFFIDTANNIISYIETIYNLLKKDGMWVNFGPLLYHYQDMEQELSIELSWEELEKIITNYGFKIEQQEFKKTTYCSQKSTMMSTMYNCIFFVATKI